MGETVSIKVKIADREYPMRVNAEDQKKIWAAAELLNDRITNFKKQFNIDDKQDLLSMVAFDLIVQLSNQNEANGTTNAGISKEIINKLLDLDAVVTSSLTH